MSSSSNGTILIIDDNPTNLEVLAAALDNAGYEILVEMDGTEGLKTVQRQPPDLILLDVMMPDINGMDVCRQLQMDPLTAPIPIIFMTALSETNQKVQGLSLGAVDYITKPFQAEEVIARIRLHLKLRRLTLELANQNEQLEKRVQERTAELSQTLTDLKMTQLQLIQYEKMSSLGNLVAGVAHEINNPVGCIAGNVNPIQEYFQDVFRLLDLYQQYYPQPVTEVQTALDAIELDFIRDDLAKLISSMNLSVTRIRDISTSLRTFARSDTHHKVPFNLHEGIDSTILILKHRLKANEHRPEIEVITQYGELPPVECFPGKLNQVFMNILSNAIDALDDANQGRSYQDIKDNPNYITIQTLRIDEYQVSIQIKDNGTGMSEKTKTQIFDHLFTTKEIGKGTGLGLAITHQIIVENHGGMIEVDSTPGEGTTFTIYLPIQDTQQWMDASFQRQDIARKVLSESSQQKV